MNSESGSKNKSKSKRGAKNMDSFNSVRQEAYVIKIKNALDKIKKNRLKFTTSQQLQKLVEFETKIAGTTFDRNKKYAELIADFFTVQKHIETVGKNFDLGDASPETLRAKILELQLTISTVEEKNRQHEADRKRNMASLKKQKNSFGNGNDFYAEFSDTAIALALLLRSQREIITVNEVTGSIDNIGGRQSEKVIVEPLRAAAFMKWQKDNKEILANMLLPFPN